MTVINLIGGPGCGKSTIASGLFYYMKINGFNVEMAREWIKSAVYEGRKYPLTDGLYILAKQNKLLRELDGKVDYVITDAPLFLPVIYQKTSSKYFSKFAVELYNSYNNINILVKRSKSLEYDETGRCQTYEEALAVDESVKAFYYKHIDTFFDSIVDINNKADDDLCNGTDVALKLYYYIEGRHKKNMEIEKRRAKID